MRCSGARQATKARPGEWIIGKIINLQFSIYKKLRIAMCGRKTGARIEKGH